MAQLILADLGLFLGLFLLGGGLLYCVYKRAFGDVSSDGVYTRRGSVQAASQNPLAYRVQP